MLRYPNARLAVHNLLSGEGLSGAQAIEEGARRFGIIAPDADLQYTTDCRCGCHCLLAARHVVNKHFEEQNKAAPVQVDPERVWDAVERHINSLPQTEGGGVAGHCHGHADCDGEPFSSCLKHAPALLDIMLQQIVRYT